MAGAAHQTLLKQMNQGSNLKIPGLPHKWPWGWMKGIIVKHRWGIHPEPDDNIYPVLSDIEWKAIPTKQHPGEWKLIPTNLGSLEWKFIPTIMGHVQWKIIPRFMAPKCTKSPEGFFSFEQLIGETNWVGPLDQEDIISLFCEPKGKNLNALAACRWHRQSLYVAWPRGTLQW